MKSFALFLCFAALGTAADFRTGQAARLVIGQPTFTAQHPVSSETILGGVSGLAYANGTLFVVDSNRPGATPNNNRILVYRNVDTLLPPPTVEFAPNAGRCPVCTGTASTVVGQPDFTSQGAALSQTGLQLPTAVASDGRILAVADTNNNRVLIWNSIPSTNGAPADVVVGQESFSARKPLVTDQTSLRGPQGVWVQNGKLFVADTQNHRVLIWNSIPTTNNSPADVVLGQANFNVGPEIDITQTEIQARPNNLLNPVSVTSDGQRLYVSDLGHNRVLIWNSIPTQNQTPADVVIGQPDMDSATANNSLRLCPSSGVVDGEPAFPRRCLATLDFPRYALSDGTRLFIADGGNDRVLIFDRVPTSDGQVADSVLGQGSGIVNQTSDSALPERVSAADSLRTPLGLAWDGTNLYVSDPFNRRVLVFTPGDVRLPNTGVRNAASPEIFAVGAVTFSGEVKANDEVTIKIVDKEYKYTIAEGDDFAKIINELVAKINEGEGDPNAFATGNTVFDTLILTARQSGPEGNLIAYSTTTNTGAVIFATAAAPTLDGGQDAARIAPGSLVTLIGDNFTNRTQADNVDDGVLPFELGGVQVYFDGIRAPLMYVSPTQINAQLPFDVGDTTSINAYVRTARENGEVTITNAVAVPIVPHNPGIFAHPGTDPRPGIILHGSSYATASVAVDGTARANDVATIKIEDRPYSYTVRPDDTLQIIVARLIEEINGNPEEKVVASPGGQFTRVRLRSRVAGPAGEGVALSVETSADAQVILSPSHPALCCANVAGSPVTEDNPAVPGETIILYASGLGQVIPELAQQAAAAGLAYNGPEMNTASEFVYALAGGRTANVLFAGLRPGSIGIYEVQLELNSDIPTNPKTQLTIAQGFQVSNIVTFPVINTNPPAEQQ